MMGPSFPNHLYTVAGQDGGAINNPSTDRNRGTLSNSSNGWGCDVQNQTVRIKNPNGTTSVKEACFNFTTLADELDAKSLSWRYYAPPSGQSADSSWSRNPARTLRTASCRVTALAPIAPIRWLPSS